jgi:hypothetical protein
VPWNNKAYHGPGPVKFVEMTIASIKMSFPVNRRAVWEKNVDRDTNDNSPSTSCIVSILRPNNHEGKYKIFSHHLEKP